MKPTTLVFPIDEQNRILLGRKKRGFRADKYNGFGGKLEAGESFRDCAIRELFEGIWTSWSPRRFRMCGCL